jgi:uncharacterized membrane protein
MQQDNSGFEAKPFSYDILDNEAAKISDLIKAVQQKCVSDSVDVVAPELFSWAETLTAQGRTAEAEFLFLHAINLWQKNIKEPIYPIAFRGLKEYAKALWDMSANVKLETVQSVMIAQIEPIATARPEANAA